MNIVGISGRLAQDPVLRHTQKDNTAVCSFTVAVKRPGVKDKTDFIGCTAWASTAKFINKYFKKGKPIEVQGSIIRDDYEKDGDKVRSWTVRVDYVGFGNGKKEDDNGKENDEVENNEGEEAGAFTDLDDDGEYPF